MKLAAVVVLYEPDESLAENIASYGHVSRLFIMDNSPVANERLLSMQIPGKKITYHHYGDNAGIGTRLNQAAKMAISEGFTHLLTMDQDSSFGDGVFTKYLEKVERYEQANRGSVGLYAVNYQPAFTDPKGEAREVLSTITSGSIISLSVFSEIGGYNESLFLDLVDFDFCYRAKNAGYKTILFPGIILAHTIGIRTKGRSLKNFKLSERQIHSAIRMYYILRNSLWLLKQPYLPKGAEQEIRNNLKLLKNNILYHPQKSKVYYYLWKGYLHYRQNKLGKFS